MPPELSEAQLSAAAMSLHASKVAAAKRQWDFQRELARKAQRAVRMGVPNAERDLKQISQRLVKSAIKFADLIGLLDGVDDDPDPDAVPTV